MSRLLHASIVLRIASDDAHDGEVTAESTTQHLSQPRPCGTPVIAKCGRVVIHHWADKAGGECDPWSELVGPWHLAWQEAAPPERREVVMGPHRADAVTPRGMVVELQHSPISPEVVTERETFYGDMVWLFDLVDQATRAGPVLVACRPGYHRRFVSFNWDRPRKSIMGCARPVLLDLGGSRVFHVCSFEQDTGCGYPETAATVRAWMRDGTPPEHVQPGEPGTDA